MSGSNPWNRWLATFGGPPTNQDTLLLQATFTYEAIYKPTKTSGTKMLQTYESYRTYIPINLFQKASQPGGPVGAGGYIIGVPRPGPRGG